MNSRSTAWLVATAVLAGALGLGASVLLHGSGPLRASPLGRWVVSSLEDRGDRLAVGDRVPAFDLPTLDGGRATLPRTGTITLINYWASWCAPCRHELPLLLAEARARGAGLALVPVALDTPAEARGFALQAGLPAPIPFESPGKADSSARLGNRAGLLPFSVLVGADGRLLAVRTGPFRSAVDLQEWIGRAEAAR